MSGRTQVELVDTLVMYTHSLLCVRQWSSRMGGPSGAEIGRVCRGV